MMIAAQTALIASNRSRKDKTLNTKLNSAGTILRWDSALTTRSASLPMGSRSWRPHCQDVHHKITEIGGASSSGTLGSVDMGWDASLATTKWKSRQKTVCASFNPWSRILSKTNQLSALEVGFWASSIPRSKVFTLWRTCEFNDIIYSFSVPSNVFFYAFFRNCDQERLKDIGLSQI